MPEQISWTLMVQVAGGPKLSVPGTIPVDAYDKISVAVDANETKDLNILPGGSKQVLFLLIKSDYYDPLLKYTINDGADEIELEGPQLLAGKGSVKLFDASPSKLTVKNGATKPAAIEVLVGRKVGPEPA